MKMGAGAALQRLAGIVIPFFLGSLARYSVALVAAVLVGRVGTPVELAAIGFATVLCNITGHSMVQGMCAALDTLSTQAFGAGQVAKQGVLAQRAFAICFATVCVPAAALWLAITPVLIAAGVDEEVASQVGQFALWRIPGLITQCGYVSLAKTLNAQRLTRPGMYCSWIACPIGLACSYVGIVELRLGLVGAAAAATLRDVLQLALLAGGAAWFCPGFRACWREGLCDRRALQEWTYFLRLGFASLVICCVSWWSWDAATVLCARLPGDTTTALATQTVVVNVVGLLYLAPGAVARGASALVGNALGGNQPAEGRDAFRLVLGTATVVSCVQMVVVVLCSDRVGQLFTDDDRVVTAVQEILEPWGVAFAAVGGVQCALAGVVEGIGQQQAVAPIVALSYWAIGLPAGAVLAFVFEQGLAGIWKGMLAAVSLHCASYIGICLCLDWEDAASKAAARAAARDGFGGSGAAPHTPTSFPRASLADPFQGQARRQTALPLGARLCDAMLFGREPERRAASDARLRLL